VGETTIPVAEAQVMETLPSLVREALTAFLRALLESFPGQIRRIILYGSHARGEAAPDSDVDVMVVVAWEEERSPDGLYRSMYGDPRWETVVDAALDVSLEHGVWISPLVVSKDRYTAHQRWSFFQQVQREGIVLWSNSS
jgi:predicted nucleotidyltransferase